MEDQARLTREHRLVEQRHRRKREAVANKIRAIPVIELSEMDEANGLGNTVGYVSPTWFEPPEPAIDEAAELDRLQAHAATLSYAGDIPWEHWWDGCNSRAAALGRQLLQQAQTDQSDWQIFLIYLVGQMRHLPAFRIARPPHQHNGPDYANFNFHVAPLVRIGRQVRVIDPSFVPGRAATVNEWIATLPLTREVETQVTSIDRLLPPTAFEVLTEDEQTEYDGDLIEAHLELFSTASGRPATPPLDEDAMDRVRAELGYQQRDLGEQQEESPKGLRDK